MTRRVSAAKYIMKHRFSILAPICMLFCLCQNAITGLNREAGAIEKYCLSNSCSRPAASASGQYRMELLKSGMVWMTLEHNRHRAYGFALLHGHCSLSLYSVCCNNNNNNYSDNKLITSILCGAILFAHFCVLNLCIFQSLGTSLISSSRFLSVYWDHTPGYFLFHKLSAKYVVI